MRGSEHGSVDYDVKNKIKYAHILHARQKVAKLS